MCIRDSFVVLKALNDFYYHLKSSKLRLHSTIFNVSCRINMIVCYKHPAQSSYKSNVKPNQNVPTEMSL